MGKSIPSAGLNWKMGSRNGHWAGNGNLILGTGKWKFPLGSRLNQEKMVPAHAP